MLYAQTSLFPPLILISIRKSIERKRDWIKILEKQQ
jgi:hypothetical protein